MTTMSADPPQRGRHHWLARVRLRSGADPFDAWIRLADRAAGMAHEIRVIFDVVEHGA